MLWYIGNKSLHAGEGESAEPTDERSQVIKLQILIPLEMTDSSLERNPSHRTSDFQQTVSSIANVKFSKLSEGNFAILVQLFFYENCQKVILPY